jgi:hypothetical protein
LIDLRNRRRSSVVTTLQGRGAVLEGHRPQIGNVTRARTRSRQRGSSYAEYLIVLVLVGIGAIAAFQIYAGRVEKKIECQAAALAGGAPCPQGGATTAPGAATDPGGGKTDKSNPSFAEVTADAKWTKFEGPLFHQGKDDSSAIHPSDITQGSLNDCYVLSALAAIAARNPDALKEAIRDNGDGTYTITFKEPRNKPWWEFWGDDYNKVEVRVTAELPAKDGNPVFAKPGDPSDDGAELWPMLFEKAYAKYKGGYAALNKGGAPREPMTALTGKESKTYGNKDLKFDTLYDHWKNGDAIAANTISGDAVKKHPLFQADAKPEPLAGWHIYYVTNVDPKAQTVTVRNPWGWHTAPITLSWADYQSAFNTSQTNPID